MINIHATLISCQNNGILLIGPSGSGKSDLALRMIMENNAILVADDRVNIEVIDGCLVGSSPAETFGKIEIRNLGIFPINAKRHEKISLCIELCTDRDKLERMPEDEYVDFLGVSVAKVKLYPFDCSTTYKIIAKISSILS